MDDILDALHPKEKEAILKLAKEKGAFPEIIISQASGIGVSVSVHFPVTDQEFDVTYYHSW